MAFSAKQFSFFLLLTLISSLQTYARDPQFFNKIPSTTNDVVAPTQKESLNNQPQQQDPTFQPDKENGYGLYGHESGQNPPNAAAATTAAAIDNSPYNPEYKQPPKKYLPKNYNPVAYVTQPDDINDSSSFSNNNYLNGAKNYYSNPSMQGAGETQFRNYHTAETNRFDNNYNDNYYYNNRASGEPMTRGPTRYGGGGGGGSSRFQPQGMSDTRFLENGKYFYDINAEKETNSRPYETMRGDRTVNDELYNKYSRNFNQNNGYENYRENAIGGYQNNQEDGFQDDESLP